MNHYEAALREIMDLCKGDRKHFNNIDSIQEVAETAPAVPAPVDNVALLEWVGDEGYGFNVVVSLWSKRGENVYQSGLTTAALIQKFINQQTKEV